MGKPSPMGKFPANFKPRIRTSYSKPNGLLCAVILIAILLSCESRPGNDETIDKPNVLFILTDDQGIGDLSLNGNDSIDTPHTDALLKKSTRFSRFYVNPVCAPTRAAFLSGQYPQRNGALFVTRRAETMNDEVITIAEILQGAGYRTGLFGKWHNGATYPYNPPGQGFQEFLGFSMGHYNSYYDYFLENEYGQQVPFSGYITDVLTDTAALFMETSQQPFFCMLTYPAPHTPVQAPDYLFDKYKKRGLTDYNAGIYAMIEANDLAIGRVMRSLETSGKLNNTIVIFSTDNGPNGDRFRMGLRGTKGQVDEGGVRVPFGICFGKDSPYADKPSLIDKPAANIDLLPTLIDLLEIKVPKNLQQLDGISLRPLLEGKDWRDRNIYTVKQGFPYRNYPGGFRNDQYLYILRSPGKHELYDLTADPGQQSNIFDSLTTYHQQMAQDYQTFTLGLAAESLVAPPIEIGHPVVKTVNLLAHEGEPHGQAAFHDQYGWANDWVENIQRPKDGINWPVEVINPGQYEFTLAYATDNVPEDVILLIKAGSGATGVNISPFQNRDLPMNDLVKRKEVYPRQWGEVQGQIELIKGGQNIRISPNQALEGQVLIKGLTISRVGK